MRVGMATEHYVVVDKLRLLAAIKKNWSQRVSTVFVHQGHYALDPKILAGFPAADISLKRIGDLLQYDLAQLADAAKSQMKDDDCREA